MEAQPTQPSVPPVALEQLFTLPMALHLRPLPTLEYIVEVKQAHGKAMRRARRRKQLEEKAARKRFQQRNLDGTDSGSLTSPGSQDTGPSNLLTTLRRGSATLFGNEGTGSPNSATTPSWAKDVEQEEQDGVQEALEDDSSGQEDGTDEEEEEEHDSATSSFDMAGGNSRLRPVTTSYAPHSLDTLSILLEQTDLFTSIAALSKAIRLLDRASIVKSAPAAKGAPTSPVRANASPERETPLDGSPVGPDGHRLSIAAVTNETSSSVGPSPSQRAPAHGAEDPVPQEHPSQSQQTGFLDDMDPGRPGGEKDIAFNELRTFFDTRFNVDYKGTPLNPSLPLYARLDEGASISASAPLPSFRDASQNERMLQVEEVPAEASSTSAGPTSPLAQAGDLLRKSFALSPGRSLSFGAGSSNGVSGPASPTNETGAGQSFGAAVDRIDTQGVNGAAGATTQVGGSGMSSLGDAFRRTGSLRRKEWTGSIRRKDGSSGERASSPPKRTMSFRRRQQKTRKQRSLLASLHETPRSVQFVRADCTEGMTQQEKEVHFNVRLDLHTVGLAEAPAKVKVDRSVLRDLQMGKRGNRARSDSYDEHAPIQAIVDKTGGPIVANTDSEFVGGTGLHNVVSPGSANDASVLSDSDPSSSDIAQQTATGVVGGAGSSGFTTASISASEKAPDAKDRRPSFLQKVLDIGFRNRQRSPSGVSSSGSAIESLGSSLAFTHSNKDRTSSFTSSVAHEPSLPTLTETKPSGAMPTRTRGAGGGSFGSASRPASRPQPFDNLNAVQEDAVLDDADASEVFSNSDFAEVAEAAEIVEDSHAGELLFKEGEDLLHLFRQASKAALTIFGLPDDMDGEKKTPSPLKKKDTGTSSASSVINGRGPPDSALLTPAGSIEVEREAREAQLRYNLAEEAKGHWLDGPMDPMIVAGASAFGHALGWEGIMDLCYGSASLCAAKGDYIPLGRAAHIHAKAENSSANVLAWRSDVAASAHPSPNLDKIEQFDFEAKWDEEVDRLDPELRSNDEAVKEAGDEKPFAWLKRIRDRIVNTEEQQAAAVAERNLNKDTSAAQPRIRTWKHWQDLFRSIAAWVEEYEKVRVRAGLAQDVDHEGLGSDWKATQSKDVNALLPKAVIDDLNNHSSPFRRREGIPEGLPSGPGGEELETYRWSRQNLDERHFTTPMTLLAQSLESLSGQIGTQNWPHQSGWELDYLEMCVFHSPIVAHRFPPPGWGAVLDEQTFQPETPQGRARANLCPMPTEEGAWQSQAWREWLASLKEGQILVPAVAWQAWWTLIAILNGADRSGRAYDLQFKSYEEPFSVLNDIKSIYL